MTIPAVSEQADAILASKRRTNRPHPDEPGKRIIGWIVDEDKVGLGTGLLAIEEIERRTLKENPDMKNSIENRLTVLETKVSELGKDADIKKLSEQVADQSVTIINLQRRLVDEQQRHMRLELSSQSK